MPGRQGDGRIDNPEHYSVAYSADHPAGAFAETFGNKTHWSEAMLESSRLAGAKRAIVALDVEASVLDLDDPANLVKRELRPSNVATPDRSETQRWALHIHAEQQWDGLRWWSIRDARWSVYGLWNHRSTVVSVTPLTLDHPAAVEAAEMLGR